MIYLLDTDICILALRQREPVLGRYLQHSPDDLTISTMTEAELRYGVRKSSHPEANLAKLEAFLAPLAILPFDRAAARCHAELRFELRSQPIGSNDLVIASVAFAGGLILVSHNCREFARVPGLRLEDWAE